MPEPYYKQHWIEVDPDRHAAYDQILGFHPAMEPLIRPLELAPGMNALDVGSGPGHTTLELARRVGPGGRVTGVDINSEFVDRAARRARAAGLNAEFVCQGFPPLPFPDRSFDRVFCKNVLEYVDSAPETVAEISRVTKSGGVIVAVDSDWDMIAIEMGLGAAARSLTNTIMAAAKSIAIREPQIGRQLYGLFRAARLDDVKLEVFAGADIYGRSLPMLRASFARYARDSGTVAAGEIDRWLVEIERAIENHTYMFVLPQFVARGIKP
jgi:ubiquinone/menaquinone biosynthesis C-methylase UbiE